ncbi:MAG TPA: hypothetical protein VF137_05340 [Candidatus Dormibacteraeota bacterium]
MAGQLETEKTTRYLRVKVVDHTKPGEPAIDVKLPTQLVKFGLKMGRAFSPEMAKANLDWQAVSAMLDEGAVGELVHVEDEVEHKTIDVFVE